VRPPHRGSPQVGAPVSARLHARPGPGAALQRVRPCCPAALLPGLGQAATLQLPLRLVCRCAGDPAASTAAAGALHDKYGAYLFRSYGWRQLGRASVHLARGDDSQAFAAGAAAALGCCPRCRAAARRLGCRSHCAGGVSRGCCSSPCCTLRFPPSLASPGPCPEHPWRLRPPPPAPRSAARGLLQQPAGGGPVCGARGAAGPGLGGQGRQQQAVAARPAAAGGLPAAVRPARSAARQLCQHAAAGEGFDRSCGRSCGCLVRAGAGACRRCTAGAPAATAAPLHSPPSFWALSPAPTHPPNPTQPTHICHTARRR
jgi:hypothetical protein